MSEVEAVDNGSERNSEFPGSSERSPSLVEAVKRTRTGLIALIGVGMVLAAVAVVAVSTLIPSRLEKAADACDEVRILDAFAGELKANLTEVQLEEWLETVRMEIAGATEVSDGGSTLIVRTKPSNASGRIWSALAMSCVMEELEFPDWLVNSIGTTRALDGRQSEAWNGLSLQWSYHPDNGVNLVIRG